MMIQNTSQTSYKAIYAVLFGITCFIGLIAYKILPPLESIEMTQAWVVGYDECTVSGKQNHPRYREIYQFEHDGNEYTFRDDTCLPSSKRMNSVNIKLKSKTTTILYDKNNANDNITLDPVLFILAFWLLIVFIFVFAIISSQRKGKNKADSSHSDHSHVNRMV